LGAREKTPTLNRTTIKARRKKRYSLVTDENFITLMKAVGKRIESPGRSVNESRGEKLLGVYILPTNNVIEIFTDADANEKAVLFNNIDVWISFEPSDMDN
jgi:hypothetical protein